MNTSRHLRLQIYNSWRWIIRNHYVLVVAFGATALGIGSAVSSPSLRGSWFVVGFFLTAIGYNMKEIKAREFDRISAATIKLRGDLDTALKRLMDITSKRAFLIVAEFEEAYQTWLIHSLIDEMEDDGFLVTILVPQYARGEARRFATRQNSKLDQISLVQDDFSCGVVISMHSDKRYQRIEKFAADFRKPLVVLDNLTHPKIPDTTFVEVSSATTGRLAGEAALQISESRKMTLRKVLVLCGDSQAPRHEQFSYVVKSKYQNCDIQIKNAGYSQDRARGLTHDLFSKFAVTDDTYQVIFCTSDAMTLGCLEALKDIDPSYWTEHLKPSVVGHDGIPQTLELLESDDEFLTCVIATDPSALARQICDALQERLASSKLGKLGGQSILADSTQRWR